MICRLDDDDESRKIQQRIPYPQCMVRVLYSVYERVRMQVACVKRLPSWCFC